eukprot:864079-Pelagomonas_calceolata.AAC.1
MACSRLARVRNEIPACPDTVLSRSFLDAHSMLALQCKSPDKESGGLHSCICLSGQLSRCCKRPTDLKLHQNTCLAAERPSKLLQMQTSAQE